MKTVLTLQITLFLLIAVGFVVKKMHIVGYQGQKNLNDLVIYVILPCNSCIYRRNRRWFGICTVSGDIAYIYRYSDFLCDLWKGYFPKGIEGSV